MYEFGLTSHIKTAYTNDGLIETSTLIKKDGMEISFYKQIVDTQDSQIRQSLIELGWTPPKDK